MKISTKGRYALRVMVDIVENESKLNSIKEIATRQDISVKYLEQIVSMLVKANLLVSFRGANGGYKLSRPANSISVLEILNATEGDVAIVECLEKDFKCKRSSICKTKSCWEKLNNLILNFLQDVYLTDLTSKNI